MINVTQPAQRRHQASPPRLTRAAALAEAARVLEQLGITAAALHMAERADRRSAGPADAVDSSADAS